MSNEINEQLSTIKSPNNQDCSKLLLMPESKFDICKIIDEEKCLTTPISLDICHLNSTKINPVSNVLDSVVFEWIYNTSPSSPRLLETKIMITADSKTTHNAAENIRDLIIREVTKIQEKFQKQSREEIIKVLDDGPKNAEIYNNTDIIRHLKLNYENIIENLQDKISHYDENYKKLLEYKYKLECLVDEQKSEILDFEQCIQKLNEDCSMFVERTNRYLENESETCRVLKAELKEKSRSEKHLTLTIKMLEKQCMFYKDGLERVTNETTSSNHIILNDLKESNNCLKIQLKEKLNKEEILIKNIKELNEKINEYKQINHDKNLINNLPSINESDNKLTLEKLRNENAIYKVNLETEDCKNRLLNEKFINLIAEFDSLKKKLAERENCENINKNVAHQQIEQLQENLLIKNKDIIAEEQYTSMIENLQEELHTLREKLKASQESETICNSALEVTAKRLVSVTSDIENYKTQISDLEQKIKEQNPKRDVIIEKLIAELYKQTKLKTEFEHELNKSVKTIKKLQAEINLYKNENEKNYDKIFEIKNQLKLAYIDQRQLSNLKKQLDEQVRVNNLLVQKICEIRQKSSEEFAILFQQLNNLKLHNKDIKPAEFEQVHRGIKIKLDSLKQLKYLLSDDNLISRLNYSERKKKEFTRHVIKAIKMLK